jgi:hypothetical protein
MNQNAPAVQKDDFKPQPKAVFVDPSIHQRLKTLCTRRADLTMQQAGEQALTEWLDRQERQGHAA